MGLKLFKYENQTECKFIQEGVVAQLPSLLVLAYIYFNPPVVLPWQSGDISLNKTAPSIPPQRTSHPKKTGELRDIFDCYPTYQFFDCI